MAKRRRVEEFPDLEETQPIITEKSIDPIEDTNSFLLKEDMNKDASLDEYSKYSKKEKEFMEKLEKTISFELSTDEILDEIKEKDEEEKIQTKPQKKKSKLKIFLISLIILFCIGIGTIAFLLYGPYKGFRNWLITTAMTTLNHQYFATWFYNDETIQTVLSENVVIESGEDTDTNLITVGNIDFNTAYANKYEKEILTKEENNDVYKVIDIKGVGYKGYLVAIYDPARISVITSKNIGTTGQYLVDMAKDNDAILAINGGGFIDPNYNSNGGVPQGVVIKNSKIISNKSYIKSGGLIGFTKDNKLFLGRVTAQEALKKGVRDGVSFGPFLIVNGARSFIKGNGGWGTAPRTAIGQRQDGIVLMLVIDGRTIKNPGADMVDLTDIMENYGAYNAANLDGGTSTALVIDDKLINDPVDGSGRHQTRTIATGFMVK